MTEKSAISWVDTSLSTFANPVLMVDGKPFLYRGAQLRADTMAANLGWSDDDIGKIVHDLADDGFTVVSIPLFWSDIELHRDQFDWAVLHKYLDWAKGAGIRLEIAWFGSDSTGYSWGDNPTMHRTPDYLREEFTLVADWNGEPLVSPIYQRILLDKADRRLLAREAHVLDLMMHEVDDWCRGAECPLIGVQVLNEPYVSKVRDSARHWLTLPRSFSAPASEKWESEGWHSPASFRRAIMLDYLCGLSSAIKSARLPVWTRANFCRHSDAIPLRENEALRQSGGTQLDIIGFDPYTHDLDYLRSFGSSEFWSLGRNLPMIMENYAGGPLVDFEILSALAGGAVTHSYPVIESENLSDSTGYPGVYGRSREKNAGTPTDATAYHRRLNRSLGLIRHAVATKCGARRQQSEIAFFNVRGSIDNRETFTLADIDIRFETRQQGYAIACFDAGYLLITAVEYAEIQLSKDILTIEYGCQDDVGRWVGSARFFGPFPKGETIALDDGKCIRIEFKDR